MRELVSIVVPVFNTEWHPVERLLLRRAVSILGEFSWVIVCSDELDISSVTEVIPGATIYRFSPSSFADRTGYTRLTLTTEFYEFFGWAQYILLFEPKSYITRNHLRYWCKQGHDYISDETGTLSLRDVDRFASLCNKGGKSLHEFLNNGYPPETDYAYWQKKSKGFWPALRSPTSTVARYFSLPLMQAETVAELPFALTGIDTHSDEHVQFLHALEL